MINQYCKTKGINYAEIRKPEYMESVQRRYGFRDWDSVLAAVGHGGLKEGQVVNRMLDEYQRDHKKKITDAQGAGGGRGGQQGQREASHCQI